MIRNIIFDLGNVLFFLDFTKTYEILKKYLRPQYTPEYALNNIIRGKVFEDFNKGLISKKEYFNHCKGFFLKEIDEKTFWKHYSDIFIPNKELLSLLPKLKKDYNLYILSNTDEVHIDFLENHYRQYFNLFNGKIYSFKTGYMKPDRKIYEYLLNSYNIKPEESLFIDDIEKNLLPAKLLNIKTFLYNKKRGKELAKILLCQEKIEL